jgi:hypothetical protein
MNKLKTLLSKFFSIFKTEKVIEIPSSKETEPPTPEPKEDTGEWNDETCYQTWKELAKTLEEQTKQTFLPVPKTKRITRTHGYIPPAEQHRDAISKAMKGKGGSARYRKTIKTSPKIKIEEED